MTSATKPEADGGAQALTSVVRACQDAGRALATLRSAAERMGADKLELTLALEGLGPDCTVTLKIRGAELGVSFKRAKGRR